MSSRTVFLSHRVSSPWVRASLGQRALPQSGGVSDVAVCARVSPVQGGVLVALRSMRKARRAAVTRRGRVLRWAVFAQGAMTAQGDHLSPDTCRQPSLLGLQIGGDCSGSYCFLSTWRHMGVVLSYMDGNVLPC